MAYKEGILRRLIEAVEEAKVVGIDIIMAERSDDDAVLDTAMKSMAELCCGIH